MNNNIYNYEIL